MPHIDIPEEIPGIRGLMSFKPTWGQPLLVLAQTLLRGDSSLSEGERELIAAYVSARNECRFCFGSHAAAARELLEDPELMNMVVDDVMSAPLTDRLRALLELAALVQQSGRDVTEATINNARASGASDEDIHDTVLIAAAFCMFNRYVDGLDAITPEDDTAYKEMGKVLAFAGYVRD